MTPVIIAGPLHGQLIQNADGTFNYVSELNYFGTDSFTYQVNDAQSSVLNPQSSGIVTVSLTINAVNDAPVAVAAEVTGTEDTPYVFAWSDFRVSDVDSVDLGITINTLPADGLLQYYDGIQWTAVLAGQRVTKADIDARLLCFNPDANESGFEGYGLAGTGNNMRNYASFTYQADDGFLSSAVASMTVNITPVADVPALELTAPVDAYGATATLFSTSWESAANRSPTFTILPRSTLEGWRVVKEVTQNDHHHDDHGQDAFVLWSSGDKMQHANNSSQIAYAAANPLPNPDGHSTSLANNASQVAGYPPAGEGDNEKGNRQFSGNNWLELGDAQGMGHQTYGIERTVEDSREQVWVCQYQPAGNLGR